MIPSVNVLTMNRPHSIVGSIPIESLIALPGGSSVQAKVAARKITKAIMNTIAPSPFILFLLVGLAYGELPLNKFDGTVKNYNMFPHSGFMVKLLC